MFLGIGDELWIDAIEFDNDEAIIDEGIPFTNHCVCWLLPSFGLGFGLSFWDTHHYFQVESCE